MVCLISALSYREMTTHIPHEISVAVPRDARMPSLDYPPVHAYKFSAEAYQAGYGGGAGSAETLSESEEGEYEQAT